jgi:hypothetical protein
MDYADGGDLRREIVRALRPSAAPPRTARRRPAERLPTSAGALGHARPPLSPARGALEQIEARKAKTQIDEDLIACWIIQVRRATRT